MCNAVEKAKQVISSEPFKWNKPDFDWLKLNIDDCCKWNREALEEVVVSLGPTLVTLSWPVLNNMVEGKALLQGVKLCICRRFYVMVESDSQLIINMINSKTKAS
ncbi:hypothetical protein RDI58_020067 [Solanum bulbocastanum]|uniref:RNase H type-1 domain-containing protein n=1 Tax=Solanum bulbocastanum TaxID=147425 RepID=A0AAN8TEI0_SOLBU